jgi:hypothetical protein
MEKQAIILSPGAPPNPDIYPNQYGAVASTNGPITYPTITALDLYFKEIYISREIFEIYVKTKEYEVISTWREDNIVINKSSGTIPLNARDWPIQRIYYSFSPDITFNNLQKWNIGFAIEKFEIPEFMSAYNPLVIPTFKIETRLAHIWKQLQPILNLTVKSANQTYYDTEINENLYQSNNGTSMIVFDYKPNAKDCISGYSSTSNNIDFNLTYNTAYYSDGVTEILSPTNTGKLRVSYKTINVLLIDVKLLELRFN